LFKEAQVTLLSFWERTSYWTSRIFQIAQRSPGSIVQFLRENELLNF